MILFFCSQARAQSSAAQYRGYSSAKTVSNRLSSRSSSRSNDLRHLRPGLQHWPTPLTRQLHKRAKQLLPTRDTFVRFLKEALGLLSGPWIVAPPWIAPLLVKSSGNRMVKRPLMHHEKPRDRRPLNPSS
jgi:hypothetical protein